MVFVFVIKESISGQDLVGRVIRRSIASVWRFDFDGWERLTIILSAGVWVKSKRFCYQTLIVTKKEQTDYVHRSWISFSINLAIDITEKIYP